MLENMDRLVGLVMVPGTSAAAVEPYPINLGQLYLNREDELVKIEDNLEPQCDGFCYLGIDTEQIRGLELYVTNKIRLGCVKLRHASVVII